MQALSNDELLALLAEAYASRRRDWLMILVAYWHGLRASEVIAITVGSVQDSHITVQRLKGSLKTVQPLMPHADPLLNESQGLFDYTRGMHSNQKLFPISRVQFYRLVQKYGKSAGLPKRKCHPHALKHTIASQIIHPTGIENTRQWLGHKSIASTGEYVKVSDADAARAVTQALGSPKL